MDDLEALVAICKQNHSKARWLSSRVVQEGSEQASSADSRRMARPLPSLIPVPQKRPSNLFAKSNPKEAKRYPSRPTAARPKSCGPLWPELQKPSALLTSSSATRAFLPGAQSTLILLKTSTAWWPSTSVPPSSVFRQPPQK